MNSDTLPEQNRQDDPLAYLYPYEFVLLTTFRKNGVAVPTAMWFAHEHGKLYMVTDRMAGKVKRIRNDKRVLLAPCDAGGKVLERQVEGYARELPAAEHPYANALLASKYGAQYEASTPEEYSDDDETFIEIEPV